MWWKRCQAKKDTFLVPVFTICAKGFYDNALESAPLDCQPCNCNITHTRNNSNICSKTQRGQCPCLEGYAGRDCSFCAKGFYDNSFEGNPLNCQPCNCNIDHTINNSNICSKTQRGQCSCLEGYAGRDCSYCKYLITYFF